MRGPTGLIGAPPVGAPATAQFTYRGGPLLTAVEIVTVFWGAPWAEATAQATATSLNAFFQQVSQHRTPQKKIDRWRSVGTARVPSAAPGTSVTDNAVQQMREGEVA